MRTKFLKYLFFTGELFSSIMSYSQTYTMSNNTHTTCSGTFLDSGGSLLNYSNNESYILTFFPNIAGNSINLNFSSFSIEPYHDYFKIYDGASTASPILVQATGTQTLGNVSATGNNPTGALTIEFTSNGAATNIGWYATIGCAVNTSSVYVMQGGTVAACSGTIYDSGGANSNYSWLDNNTTTYCPDPGKCMKIDLSSVKLEPEGDTLYIYDGPDRNYPLLATYHNTTSIPGSFEASITNTTGCLSMRFKEDGWTLFPGWEGTVSCVPCAKKSSYAIRNGTIATCDAMFYDNGGPYGDYVDNQDIIQTICSTSSLTPYIKVEFFSFKTETNFDRIRVYNGPSIASPLVATLSGTLGYFWIASTDVSGCLTLRFNSDHNSPRSGWTASISCTSVKPSGNLPIELLQFSGSYDKSSNSNILSWITASEINSKHFEVERSFDALNFSKIGTISAAQNSQIKKYYSFIDNSLEQSDNLHYYRLKMVDQDNSFEYSNLIFVASQYQNIISSIYPNPFNEEINILFENVLGNNNISFRILNPEGIILNEEIIFSENLMHKYKINTTKLPNGCYILEIKSGEKVNYYKCIKINNYK